MGLDCGARRLSYRRALPTKAYAITRLPGRSNPGELADCQPWAKRCILRVPRLALTRHQHPFVHDFRGVQGVHSRPPALNTGLWLLGPLPDADTRNCEATAPQRPSLDDPIPNQLHHEAHVGRSSQFSLDGRHDRRDINSDGAIHGEDGTVGEVRQVPLNTLRTVVHDEARGADTGLPGDVRFPFDDPQSSQPWIRFLTQRGPWKGIGGY